MAKFNGGWNDLKVAEPIPVSFAMTYAKFDGVVGTVKNVTTFHNPTGGAWTATPISITSAPTIAANNGGVIISDSLKADLMNNEILTYNSSAPPPMNNVFFLIGNPEMGLFFKNSITVGLGAGTFNLVQISFMANSATSGDDSGKVEVFDFGSANHTGNVTLEMAFSGYFGECNLGIRLEDNANHSSIYELRAYIIDVDDDASNGNYERGSNKKKVDEILKAKKKKNPGPIGYNLGIPGVEYVSPSSSLITRPWVLGYLVQ